MARVQFLPPFRSLPGVTRGLTYPAHSPWAIDLNRGWGATDLGDPVLCSLAGTVSELVPAFGGVEVRHPWGYVTRYFHLADVAVKLGQEVDGGHELGTVGRTYPKPRILSPHLHYEQWRFGRAIRISFRAVYYPASLRRVDHLVYGPAITGQ